MGNEPKRCFMSGRREKADDRVQNRPRKNRKSSERTTETRLCARRDRDQTRPDQMRAFLVELRLMAFAVDVGCVHGRATERQRQSQGLAFCRDRTGIKGIDTSFRRFNLWGRERRELAQVYGVQVVWSVWRTTEYQPEHR